jgi:spore coat protein U-like protein
MRLSFLRLAALLICIASLGGRAYAGCVPASTNVTFAPSSSYSVLDGSIAQVSGQAGLACTGALLSVLGGSYARATFNSANAFKLKNAGGDLIPYRLSVDSGGLMVIAQNGTVDYMNVTLLALLGIGSINGFNAPIFAKLTAAPNIPAGTYTDTISVAWDYHICNGAQVAVVCVAYENGQTNTAITVTLEVQNDCRISAPNVSFGSVALVSQFGAVNQAVLVNCTKNATYHVAFSKGLSNVSRPWRTMTSGANSLQYNIYRADGVTIWDETNPLTSSQQGTGSTTPSQVQNYVAKVNPSQVTPPPGSYSDTVSVVVTF